MGFAMTETTASDLTSLHTAAIDARNGYAEALKDADGNDLSALFQTMISLHTRHADELKSAIGITGTRVDDDGSLMSTVHRSIMSVRSLFGALDETVLPGLIDGEERNVQSYDDVLTKDGLTDTHRALLTGQRARLVEQITAMRSAAKS